MAYEFANCEIDPERHVFLRDGKAVHLEPQVFDLLLVLAESQGLLLTKDELVRSVWQGLSISDASISARINAARKAVGDTGRDQAIIKTVHGRGFQMVSPVRQTSARVILAAPARSAENRAIRLARSTHGAQIAHTSNGAGPPLVRAAHWLSHLELDRKSPVWQPLIDALSRNHRLFRYDQRGTGLSSRNLDHAGLDAFADDLKAVADANDLDRFPIFAASQAVPVAIRFAVRYPQRVSGLVLYGGFATGRAIRAPTGDELDEDTIMTLIRAGWGKRDGAFMQAFSTLFMPDATAAQLDSFVAMQTATIAPENAARLRQIVDRFDVGGMLSSVHAPTLVIHAIRDAVQPVQQGQMLASEIRQARYLPLDSRNHMPLPQEASWTVMLREIQAFLAEIDL